MKGSLGGSSHENLELVLAKSLTRKDERVESQSKYHPVFATWADKPHDTVSKVVSQTLDSTSTKELEGVSYRQSALIPTCDALKIKPCTVIIQAGYTTEIKDSR